MTQPSVRQRRIAGEGHGRPSLFDHPGRWCGLHGLLEWAS